MDTTLYEEVALFRAPTVTEKKSTMLLNFAACQRQERLDGLLSSVDLGTPSPDLDKFLQPVIEISPVCGHNQQLIFPNQELVTEEQEAYARGFVDALEELHKRKGPPCLGGLSQNDEDLCAQKAEPSPYDILQPVQPVINQLCNHSNNGEPLRLPVRSQRATIHHTAASFMNHVTTQSSTCNMTENSFHGMAQRSTYQITQDSIRFSTSTIHHPPSNPTTSYATDAFQFRTTEQNPPPHQNTTVNAQYSDYISIGASVNLNCFAHDRIQRIKEEPQMVPRLGSTPPLSPINMDVQEVIKLERKRARNRMAARKCRSRKLEQISVLEARVAVLKEQNLGLAETACGIRDSVMRLRGELAVHINGGDCVMQSTL